MDWAKFHFLVNDTIARLTTAAGDRKEIEACLRRYVQKAQKLKVPEKVLRDYLSVNSPSMLQRADYGEIESEKIVIVFDRLMQEHFE